MKYFFLRKSILLITLLLIISIIIKVSNLYFPINATLLINIIGVLFFGNILLILNNKNEHDIEHLKNPIKNIFILVINFFLLREILDFNFLNEYDTIFIAIITTFCLLLLKNLSNNKSKKLSNIFIIPILIGGIFFALININSQSINVDEGILSIVAQNIKDKKGAVLDSGSTYDRSYTYTYPLALSYSFFGVEQEVNTRLISILFYFLSILFFWIISKKIIGNNFAIIATLLFIFLPINIEFSRFARMYSINLFIQLLIIFILIKYNEKNNKLLLLFLIPVFILGFLSHNIFIFSLISVATYLICKNFYFLKRIVIKNKFYSILSIPIIFSISVIILKHLKSSTKIDVLSNLSINWHITNIFLNQYTYLAPLLLFFIIFTTYNLFRKKKTSDHLVIIFTTIIPLIFIEFFIYSNFPPYRIRYIYHLIPILIIPTLLIIRALYDKNFRFLSFYISLLIFIIFVKNIDIKKLENKTITDYSHLKEIQLQENDIIITNNPVVVNFYKKQETYWLMFNKNEIELYSYLNKNQEKRYVYTDSKILENWSDLKKTIETNQGYIVLDPAFINFIGNDISKKITSNPINALSKKDVTIVNIKDVIFDD